MVNDATPVGVIERTAVEGQLAQGDGVVGVVEAAGAGQFQGVDEGLAFRKKGIQVECC